MEADGSLYIPILCQSSMKDASLRPANSLTSGPIIMRGSQDSLNKEQEISGNHDKQRLISVSMIVFTRWVMEHSPSFRHVWRRGSYRITSITVRGSIHRDSRG